MTVIFLEVEKGIGPHLLAHLELPAVPRVGEYLTLHTYKILITKVTHMVHLTGATGVNISGEWLPDQQMFLKDELHNDFSHHPAVKSLRLSD